MAITKSEIVDEIIKSSRIKRFTAGKLIDDFFEIIIKSLENGKDVRIHGFGNFILLHKKERVGRNPKTLKEHKISPRRVVSFRTGNLFKAKLKPCEQVI